MERPAATWRRRSTSFSKRAGSPRVFFEQVVDDGDVLDPVAEIRVVGQRVHDLALIVEAAFAEIDRDHLAGAKAALAADAVLRQLHHAGLGARHQQPVIGDRIAHRAQAIAVGECDHPVAGKAADRGRSVPRLHHRVAIGEQVLVLLRHGGAAVPHVGHQQALHHRQRPLLRGHDLEHVVERGGIGTARLDHRLQLRDALAIDRRIHPRLVRLHPVDVAFQRVDLAIVGDHAERLRQVPGREGVGRIALVIDREVGDEALVQQVGIERGQLLGEEHALVDDRAAGERADVELADAFFGRGALDPAPDDIEVGLEHLLAHALRVGDHDLLDLGARGVRLLADDADIHRHLAPAIDGVAVVQDLALDDDAAGLLLAEVGARQEDLADAELAGAELLADLAHIVLEEGVRDLHVDAGAVAGLAVGIDRAAVPHRFQRLDPHEHDLAPRLAIDRRDHADATGIVLVGRVVEAGGGEVLRLLRIGLGPVGHRRRPQRSPNVIPDSGAGR